MKLAIIGAGWAGMAAAVQATTSGHNTTVFETSRTLGGRARAVTVTLPDGNPLVLDNGQHILIGAYTQTLALMRQVGLDPAAHLLRLPLALQFPDGSGLALPDWPSPLDALGGIWRNPGWSWQDKWSLLRGALHWQRRGFKCAPQVDVFSLCKDLSPRVMQTLIEPLCVSALNTPAQRASGQVFLRVLQDSLFGARGGSNLLLPTSDLSTLFPQTAADWLLHNGGHVRAGMRVTTLSHADNHGWNVNGEHFDAVFLSTGSSAAAAMVLQATDSCPPVNAQNMKRWASTAQALQFEEIATVYALAPGTRLPQPMLALQSDAKNPAQFVFDRGQLNGPAGLLAFVVSANSDDREAVQAKVLRQAQSQLARFIGDTQLTAVQTIVEKRATFACTPGLQRPPMQIAPGLLACGDYVEGPYPATLEGAVRSGMAAAGALA